MVRRKLVVAALLLANLAGIATAADIYEHNSNHARKLIATLNSLGINSKQVREFISDIDASVNHENKTLSLAGHEVPGGHVMLRYRFGAVPVGSQSHKRLELAYQPQNVPHLEVVARTDSIMVSYHFKF